jgi:Uma2 family endonuclease
METKTGATVNDLYNAPNDWGTHELVDGKLVHMPPTGLRPNYAALVMAASLLSYEKMSGKGRAATDNRGYIVHLPNRQSLSPDASYTFDIPDHPMRFVEGAPVFAAEVRSEHDYGPAADAAYAAKRRDYFTPGTVVVWDVDPVPRVVRSYRAA